MDIVDRLREGKSAGGYWREKEAADEIERLREQCEFEKKCRNDAFEELKQRDADIERLRDTLVKIVSFHEVCMKDKKEIMIFLWGDRAALKEGE